jgi:LacI family transcriptional regulator
MGYKQALQEAGLTVDPDLIIQGDFRSCSGYENCRALAALSDPPTAIFACNDLMAIGALKAAHDLGLRIPQ